MARVHKSLNKSEYVRVAMEFVEEYGLGQLTMRALGEQLGVDPTAVYRHFPSKEVMIEAMLDQMMAESAAIEPVGSSPRERIMSTALNLRSVFHAHPQLTTAFATAIGTYPNGLILTKRLVTELRTIGLKDDDLVQMYQTMESFVMGSATFEAGGNPSAFEQRAQRYRVINEPEFDVASSDSDTVKQVAHRGFILTLNLMIDESERIVSAYA
jgi:TetR/AcrR family transcriptional regulator, tetracycline repressor protein